MRELFKSSEREAESHGHVDFYPPGSYLCMRDTNKTTMHETQGATHSFLWQEKNFLTVKQGPEQRESSWALKTKHS